jgi:methyl-accepting chemotaxis protein
MNDTATHTDSVGKPFHRHPLGNFFILRDLQLRLISKVVAVGVVSTLVAVTTLLAVYVISYKSIDFWLVNMGNNAEIAPQPVNIISLILPSLLIGTIVNIIVTFCVGLYASRKYAVPIYKLEQWAALLINGHMTARLTFREKEELKELSTRCNLLADSLRRRFIGLRDQLESLKKTGPADIDALKAMEKSL